MFMSSWVSLHSSFTHIKTNQKDLEKLKKKRIYVEIHFINIEEIIPKISHNHHKNPFTKILTVGISIRVILICSC